MLVGEVLCASAGVGDFLEIVGRQIVIRRRYEGLEKSPRAARGDAWGLRASASDVGELAGHVRRQADPSAPRAGDNIQRTANGPARSNPPWPNEPWQQRRQDGDGGRPAIKR